MASIAPIVIGCIDYLAYGTIFTRAMFLPKKKLDVFFPARKAGDEPRRVVGGRVLIKGIQKKFGGKCLLSPGLWYVEVKLKICHHQTYNLRVTILGFVSRH